MAKTLPGTVEFPNGERYKAQVFLINTKDENGNPRLCTMIPDKREIELAGGEEFMICYVPETMLAKEDG